ncbi:extracellular solute-binding protein family 5 [Halorubrum aidingense JCM 13560]|uniref:Extracellular solute-binding protein family 5 n=1 Tax=Halorubrum aidingense JCM 13560 TaxID=1230454 RepID=M0P6R9_9EURY|nr:ABC transporter substrate-binding protein [Halorubrum aidingense]EMA65766.1 extracellular solute-binding protein family 5 [Halorubrum aidingense JCM 13560]
MTRQIGRRKALAGVGTAVLSAGCIGRVRNIAGRDRPGQLSLEINTMPADNDPNGIRIARQLAENAEAVGIEMQINTMSLRDLRRRVLLNHNFDIYVGQFREAEPFDPDVLYSLTHSRFGAETGWQNPFGFADFGVDELLSEQRTAEGDRRRSVVSELQEALVDRQPFTVVAFPDALTAIRDERFEGWGAQQPLSIEGLLGLEHRGSSGDETGDDAETDGDTETDGDGDEADTATLELVTTDQRVTENWNPIAPEYRRYGTFTSLLYDQLVRMDGDEAIPWLAAAWERSDPETFEVTLRDAQWHDGEPVSADDVAFTYEFLGDTSMGNVEAPVPAPRFRGRTSLVQSVTAVDDATVRFEIGDVSRRVGLRALQVPILPEHVWRERTSVATIAGFEFDGETTEAVVSNNENPVGSGPMRLVEATAEESVVFERNAEHFLVRAGQDGGVETEAETGGETTNATVSDDGTTNMTTSDGATNGGTTNDGTTESGDGDVTGSSSIDGIPERFRGKPAFERLRVEVAPSDIAAVQAVGDGLADATFSNLGPDSVPRLGREADARLVSTRSAAFYHIGYNTRRAPLSNPRFRGVLASLIDKPLLVDEAFEGYAQPAASPLAASPEWVPEGLQWSEDDTDPVHPFLGEDGAVDVEAARDELREAGYRFGENGRLLSRDQ